MSPEHCEDHSELMKTVGQMDGKLDMLTSGVERLQQSISDLYTLYNAGHVDAEVQKTKIAPVFYVVTIAAGVIIGMIIKGVWK